MPHPTVTVSLNGQPHQVSFGPRTLGRIEEAMGKTTFELAMWLVGDVKPLKPNASAKERAAWEASEGMKGVKQFKAGQAMNFVDACLPNLGYEPSNKELAQVFPVLVGGFMDAFNELFGPEEGDEEEAAAEGEHAKKKGAASGSVNSEPGPSSSSASGPTSSKPSTSATSAEPTEPGKPEDGERTPVSAS